jgi:hypothetical protein
MIRPKLAEGTLLSRYSGSQHAMGCFVCSLEVASTHTWHKLVSGEDFHSRIVHGWCWKLILRYAQVEIDRQKAGK